MDRDVREGRVRSSREVEEASSDAFLAGDDSEGDTDVDSVGLEAEDMDEEALFYEGIATEDRWDGTDDRKDKEVACDEEGNPATRLHPAKDASLSSKKG